MCEKIQTFLLTLKKNITDFIFSQKYCLFKKAFEVSLMILGNGMEEKTDELFKEESQRIKDVILNNFYFAIRPK